MKILNITFQHRRDFRAVYECEHCDHTYEGSGYDDGFFHSQVIPNMECSQCNKKANESYRPLAPKYPEGLQI